MKKNNFSNRKELTIYDYKNILKFYKLPIDGSYEDIKRKAENILSSKLCRCIKKVGSLAVSKKSESRAIGICTKTIIDRKGFTRGKFKCKGKRNLTLKKRY
jgi:hypothetical protein